MANDNPLYTVADFRSEMPAFSEEAVSDDLIKNYLDMAHSVVRESVWRAMWREGMRLFTAHFLTLYLQGPQSAAGPVSAERVGEVSVSYDASCAQDLRGWGAWRETGYGRRFATLARAFAKPGMYVP